MPRRSKTPSRESQTLFQRLMKKLRAREDKILQRASEQERSDLLERLRWLAELHAQLRRRFSWVHPEFDLIGTPSGKLEISAYVKIPYRWYYCAQVYGITSPEVFKLRGAARVRSVRAVANAMKRQGRLMLPSGIWWFTDGSIATSNKYRKLI